MDRGIPTEESLAAMRASQPPDDLVGVPKGRLTKLEKKLTELPWREARDQVQVKLLPEEGEVYVLVNSQARVDKERAMRRRRLKKLGVAQAAAGRVASLGGSQRSARRPAGQSADLHL